MTTVHQRVLLQYFGHLSPSTYVSSHPMTVPPSLVLCTAWKERPGSDYDWACQHTLLIAATRIPLNHYATRAQKSVCMSGEISWVEPESWDTVIFSPLLARVPQSVSCISVCDSSVTHLPRFFLKHMDLFSALCKSMCMHTSELTTPPWPNCLYWSCKFDESDLLNH